MYLDPKNIFIHLEAADRRELFSKMGGHLLDNGYVRDSFFEALIEREAKFPTGLPGCDYGIAIPHVDSCHVLRPGIAVATLAAPVQFDVMGSFDDTVGVSIVFMLLPENADKQIDLLMALMPVIQNNDLIADLLSSEKAADLYAKLAEAL